MVEIFRICCPDIDTPILEYLAGLVEFDNNSDSTSLFSVLGEYLYSYELAHDEISARELCKRLADEFASKNGMNTNKKSDNNQIVAATEFKPDSSQYVEGALIMAKWEGDSQYYDAVIDSIITPGKTYKITFVEYNEQSIVDIENMKLLGTGIRIADILTQELDVEYARFMRGEISSFDYGKGLAGGKSLRQLKKEEKASRREANRIRLEREAIKIQKQKKLIQSLHTWLKNRNQIGIRKMDDIVINQLTLPSFASGPPFLENTTLTLVKNRRYGLIGRNGVGKTTLLSELSSYNLGFPKYLRVLHVEQEIEGNDLSVINTVLQADVERTELIKEENEINKKLGINDKQDTDIINIDDKEKKICEKRIIDIHKRLTEIDAWSAQGRASSILTGLGFTEEMKEVPTKLLSGGWRMRVTLARALLVQPDVLFLDEPTNHLDFPAVLWLESFLKSYKRILVIVSHDRLFLDHVVTDIILFANSTLEYFTGNFTSYEKVKAQRRLNLKRTVESQQRVREHTQKFIDKFRANAKRAALVQSRIKMLNRIEQVHDIHDDPTFLLSFPDPGEMTAALVILSDVGFGYIKTNGLLFTGATFRVDMGARIGVLGANGVGKTTLIKLILREIEPCKGNINFNPHIRISCFTQHHVELLDIHMTPLEQLKQLFKDKDLPSLRKQLAQYGITGGLATQKIHSLSGGQRSRLSLSIVTYSRPHLLILDEPSNHLDLETVDALALAIGAWGGAVIMVSHDQYLLSQTCNEFLAISEKLLKKFNNFEEARDFGYGKLAERMSHNNNSVYNTDSVKIKKNKQRNQN